MNKMTILRYLLATGALLALCFVVDWYSLLETFYSAHLGYLALLFLLSFPLIGVSVVKWRLFLMSFGSKPSLWRLFRLYLLGYFANLFIPSQFGGDVVRSASLGKEIGQRDAAVSTFLERYTGVVAMVLLGVPGVILVQGLTLEIRLVYSLVFVSLCGLTAALFSSYFWNFVGVSSLPLKVKEKLKRLAEALLLIPRQPGLVVRALLLSIVFHTLTVVNTACAAYAVGWFELPLLSLFVVLPLVLLLAALPLTPNGLGIQEGAFYFFLTSLGASPEQAIAVAVLLRAKAYLLGVCGGVVLLFNSPAKSLQSTESLPQDKTCSDSV